MSQNVDAMVRAGVDAYRAGNKEEARALLERAIELDSYNETAWLWLSAVVETKEEQQTCLENVLVINPENSRAIQGLKSLGVDPDAIIAQAQADASAEEVAESAAVFTDDIFADAASNDVFADVDFGAEADSGGADDLFGDIDFSDAGGAFDIDDNIFNDEPVATADDEYAYDDYGDDASYIDEGYYEDDAAVFDDGDDMYADKFTLEDYNDAMGEGINDYDDSQFGGDPFAEPEPAPLEPEPLSADELFAMIPKEIKPTRAPGVVESVSSVHYMILGFLALLNIGALVFVGLQFVS